MKILDYNFKSRSELTDKETTYVLEVTVEQVTDGAFEIQVLGAKSVPVSMDSEMNIPLYAFLPVFEEVQSVMADNVEDVHLHVEAVKNEALAALRAFDTPELTDEKS